VDGAINATHVGCCSGSLLVLCHEGVNAVNVGVQTACPAALHGVIGRPPAVRVVQAVPDVTGREDLVSCLRRTMVQVHAQREGCNKIAWGDCASRTAVQIIADFSKVGSPSPGAIVQMGGFRFLAGAHQDLLDEVLTCNIVISRHVQWNHAQFWQCLYRMWQAE
jgi:hypothetical protein